MTNLTLVSAIREHFVDKYFGYRRRYVDHFVLNVPSRARWALWSELARLGFVVTGAFLCAAILWALTVAAATRPGTSPAWPVACGILAALTTAAALAALVGIRAALNDRARVEASSSAAGDTPR